MTEQQAMRMALEALERSVATCFDQYAHEQVMSRPEHFVNQAITALLQALANEALDKMAENARELGLDYDAKPDERLMEMPDEPVAWVERWYGSGADQGWWVWEKGLTHGNAVARIGTGPFAERLTSIIVKKHNASVFPAKPAKEPFCADPHDPSGQSKIREQEKTDRFVRQLDEAIDLGETAEQMAQASADYAMIDHYLRCNLNSDADYAEYSAALDRIYTRPQPAAWVSLIDEDLPALAGDNGKVMELQQVRRFAKAIEAKLKEKNT